MSDDRADDGGWRPPHEGGTDPVIAPEPIVHGPAPVAAGKLAGQARAFQASVEQDPVNPQWQWTVWRFRLEHFDAAGNRLTPVSVEMRGRSFRGAVTDGDWIEVDSAPAAGDTLRVTRVRNLTTESDVVAARWRWPWYVWLTFGVVLAIVVAVMVVTLVLILRVVSDVPSPDGFFSSSGGAVRSWVG